MCIWKYRGNLCNYPEWHFGADTGGCNSLIDFLKLLVDEANNTKRTIILGKPSQQQYEIPTSNHNVKVERKLAITKSSNDGDFPLSYVVDKLQLLIGVSQISALIRGVKGVLNGKGDYCLGDDGNELWMWWQARI